MKNNKPDISELHKQFDEVIVEKKDTTPPQSLNTDKIKFPYEFLTSVDVGWIPCDIVEVDSEKELVKIVYHHPYSSGWMETCAGGIFDEVVPMWRVRLREE